MHTDAATVPELPPAAAAGRRLSIGERWESFWFEPVPPTDLAVSRLVFFGLLLAYYLPVTHVGWGSVPESWRQPIWIFQRLRLPILSDPVLAVMVPVWKASLLLSCVGLATRVSTAVAFLLGSYLVALPYNFGKTDHMTALVLFAMGIMALSRCGDAWSLDAALRRRAGRPPAGISGEYRWPVRAVWLTMTVVFFAAGVAKVTQGGAVWFSTAWVFSDHMAISLVQQHYGLDPPGVTWGLFVARHGWLARLMAAGAVVLELAAPLALVSRRLRRVLPPSLLLMQIGIGVLMNVWFTRFMFVYIFWVPWGRLLPSPATIQVNQPNP